MCIRDRCSFVNSRNISPGRSTNDSATCHIIMRYLLTDEWNGIRSGWKLVANDNLINGHRQQDSYSYKTCTVFFTVNRNWHYSHILYSLAIFSLPEPVLVNYCRHFHSVIHFHSSYLFSFYNSSYIAKISISDIMSFALS